MFPRWEQPDELFAVTCLTIRFMTQLYFKLVQDSLSLMRLE